MLTDNRIVVTIDLADIHTCMHTYYILMYLHIHTCMHNTTYIQHSYGKIPFKNLKCTNLNIIYKVVLNTRYLPTNVSIISIVLRIELRILAMNSRAFPTISVVG
jgi:hypothetical protein